MHRELFADHRPQVVDRHAMALDLIGAFVDIFFDVLEHLKFLEAVVVLDADTVRDKLDRIDDLERDRRRVTDDLAVAGMIDRRQRLDAGIRCRLERRLARTFF